MVVTVFVFAKLIPFFSVLAGGGAAVVAAAAAVGDFRPFAASNFSRIEAIPTYTHITPHTTQDKPCT